MKRLLATIFCIAFLHGCGDWVTNYDLKPNAVFNANIDPQNKDDIIAVFRTLARKNHFQIVVQDKGDHVPNGFNIMMRNPTFRIGGTNVARTTNLSVAFHKAIDPKRRPTDQELEDLVNEFRISLDAVDGVDVVEE